MVTNYRRYFVAGIKKNFAGLSDNIITKVDAHYKIISVDTSFAARSANPIDKRLDFSAYFLALIKTLDEQGEKFETTRNICLEIVTEYVRPKTKFQQLLKKLPVKLINTKLATSFLKAFSKKGKQKLKPGWVYCQYYN